jgi:hypothetical protein
MSSFDFNLTELVPIYQAAIDKLIDEMGKNVTLVYKPTVTSVSTSSDPIFGGNRSPTSQPTTTTQNTKTIKALIEWTPKDMIRQYDIKLEQGQVVATTKSYLTDVPDILRCEHAILNSDSKGFIGYKFRILREPIPLGLQQDRYALTFWQRIST